MVDRMVLVTGFVICDHPAGLARACAIHSALFGRLSTRSATALRPAGAWHHLFRMAGRGRRSAADDR
jgi:hypothetical protein